MEETIASRLNCLSALSMPLHARVVVHLQRLVVSYATEQWLGSIGPLGQRGAKNEDVLVEKRHLHVGVRAVKLDGGRQAAVCNGNADASSEILPHVLAELEAQHEKFAVAGMGT